MTRSFAELAWRALAPSRSRIYVFSSWQNESFVHFYDGEANQHYFGVSERFWFDIGRAHWRETGFPIEESYIEVHRMPPTAREVVVLMAPYHLTFQPLSMQSEPLGAVSALSSVHITEEGAWVRP